MNCTALDLRVGDRVKDNDTEWAEVITIDDQPEGCLRIEWLLANGRHETTTYRPDNRFTLIGTMPNPTCEGMERGLDDA